MKTNIDWRQQLINILNFASKDYKLMFKSALHQDYSLALKTYPKSKKIKKNIDEKIALIFRQERMQKQEMCIYVDSSEEQINHLQPPTASKSNSPQPQASLQDEMKELSANSPLQLSWSSDELSSLENSHIVKEPHAQLHLTPILKASAYKPVDEIDFKLYTTFLARTKIYGSVVIDEYGRILWCDKMAHEILEGSLNNFERMRIHHFLLSTRLRYFLQQMQSLSHYDQNTTLQWIIYSKNSKRRFSRVPFPKQLTCHDIFYRFLKHLTLRIRPISLSLRSYRDPCGYCNQNLVTNQGPQRCFFLQIRYAKQSPNLENLHIKDDPVIKKFLANIKAKHLKRSKQASRGLNELLEDQKLLIKEQKFEEKKKEGQQESRKMNERTKKGQKAQVQVLQIHKNIKKSSIDSSDVR